MTFRVVCAVDGAVLVEREAFSAILSAVSMLVMASSRVTTVQIAVSMRVGFPIREKPFCFLFSTAFYLRTKGT